MDTYTGITIAFLILSVFILSCRCYYACCYRPTPKLNSKSTKLLDEMCCANFEFFQLSLWYLLNLHHHTMPQWLQVPIRTQIKHLSHCHSHKRLEMLQCQCQWIIIQTFINQVEHQIQARLFTHQPMRNPLAELPVGNLIPVKQENTSSSFHHHPTSLETF